MKKWECLVNRRVTAQIVAAEGAEPMPLAGLFVGIDDGFLILADQLDAGDQYRGIAMLPLDTVLSVTEDGKRKAQG